MSIPVEVRCANYGEPECLGTPDLAYTLDFSDLGEPPIYFCAACGPGSHAVFDMLMGVLEAGDPALVQRLDTAITEAAAKVRVQRN